MSIQMKMMTKIDKSQIEEHERKKPNKKKASQISTKENLAKNLHKNLLFFFLYIFFYYSQPYLLYLSLSVFSTYIFNIGTTFLFLFFHPISFFKLYFFFQNFNLLYKFLNFYIYFSIIFTPLIENSNNLENIYQSSQKLNTALYKSSLVQ